MTREELLELAEKRRAESATWEHRIDVCTAAGCASSGSDAVLERLRSESKERGLEIDYERAREILYGMPYAEWKAKYQSEATAEQKAAFKEAHPDHH